MSLPPLAALDAFKRWPEVNVTIADSPRAEELLHHVSVLIRDHAGVDWVDEDDELEDVPDIVATITLTVAARVWANPTFRTSQARGPFVSAWDAGSVGLALNDDEKARITRAAAGSGFLGLSTIKTTRGEIETGTVREGWPWG